MEENAISEAKMMEARKYALCIAERAQSFKKFAVAMIDFMGEGFSPFIIDLYNSLSQTLFMRGFYKEDVGENINEETILSWYNQYKECIKERDLSFQDDFKNKIDELQFLVERCRNSAEFQRMINCVGRFKHLAAYNAMLVDVQKPGAQLVLRSGEWEKYNRRVKPNAQILIVLVPFGPVEYMFDISDTEQMPGKPYLEDAKLLQEWNDTFKKIEGKVDEKILNNLIQNLPSYGIYLDDTFQAADTYGGYTARDNHEITININSKYYFKHSSKFIISVNRRQNPTEKFHTICHELGHIFCRHIYYNSNKQRNNLTRKEEEFEAETVAWLVCKRLGINNPSEDYLASYVSDGQVPYCSTDLILKAVTEIEKMMMGVVYVKKSKWYEEDKTFKKLVDEIITKKNVSNFRTKGITL